MESIHSASYLAQPTNNESLQLTPGADLHRTSNRATEMV
jgi:hypothetical protein